MNKEKDCSLVWFPFPKSLFRYKSIGWMKNKISSATSHQAIKTGENAFRMVKTFLIGYRYY